MFYLESLFRCFFTSSSLIISIVSSTENSKVSLKLPSELVKKGANTYSLKSHDSVIISNGLWHRFSTNEAGKSAVDYLIKVEKMTLQEAVSSVLDRKSRK